MELKIEFLELFFYYYLGKFQINRIVVRSILNYVNFLFFLR